MKLNWITLKVQDLEKSLFFYIQLLHLEIAAQFGPPEHQIVMLGKAGEAKVELIFEPNTNVEQPGNGVSFGLESENLDQLVALLQEHGLSLVGPISPNPHIRFFFVKDPDGYSVQLIEQKREEG